jgi:hypothetical protein
VGVGGRRVLVTGFGGSRAVCGVRLWRFRGDSGEASSPFPVESALRADVRDQLNRVLRGWAAYFSQGTRLMAYRPSIITCIRAFAYS